MDSFHSNWNSCVCFKILSYLFYFRHYSCTNGDTWASEVGVLDKNQPYHIIYWKQVPAGTNGGVSKLGTIVSILGGTTIGIAFYISGLLFTGSYQPLSLILVGSFSGFLGSMVHIYRKIIIYVYIYVKLDSLLGATLQYSGWSPKLNKVVNLPSSDSSTIGIGNNILDNHQVCLNIFHSINPTTRSIFLALL